MQFRLHYLIHDEANKIKSLTIKCLCVKKMLIRCWNARAGAKKSSAMRRESLDFHNKSSFNGNSFPISDNSLGRQ